MKTSHNGVVFLARAEAIVLVAYPDGEHMSWGAGHNDPALKPGDQISLEDALKLLAADLAPREAYITKKLTLPVEQHEFDALVDAYYNKGSHVLPVIELINAGDHLEAMAVLLTINRNESGPKAGKFNEGLAKRRMNEIALFLHGNYGDLSKVKIWRGDPSKTKPEEIVFPKSEQSS